MHQSESLPLKLCLEDDRPKRVSWFKVMKAPPEMPASTKIPIFTTQVTSAEVPRTKPERVRRRARVAAVDAPKEPKPKKVAATTTCAPRLSPSSGHQSSMAWSELWNFRKLKTLQPGTHRPLPPAPKLMAFLPNGAVGGGTVKMDKTNCIIHNGTNGRKRRSSWISGKISRRKVCQAPTEDDLRVLSAAETLSKLCVPSSGAAPTKPLASPLPPPPNNLQKASFA